MNDVVLESFIDFCNNMQIAEEMYKDITRDWVKNSNLKNNKDDHSYEIPGKSIYNSSIVLDIDHALSDEEFKSVDEKIKRALNVIKSWQPVNYKEDLADAGNWEMDVKTETDLKSLINKLDNRLRLTYSKSRPELLSVEIYINNSSASKYANQYFGNHCHIYETTVNLDTMKLGSTLDAGLNG